MMLAESFVDGIPGSGWTAAAILVLVLVWFGKVHLPGQVATFIAQIERKDLQIERMFSLFIDESRANRKVQEDLKEALAEAIARNCRPEKTG